MRSLLSVSCMVFLPHRTSSILTCLSVNPLCSSTSCQPAWQLIGLESYWKDNRPFKNLYLISKSMWMECCQPRSRQTCNYTSSRSILAAPALPALPKCIIVIIKSHHHYLSIVCVSVFPSDADVLTKNVHSSSGSFCAKIIFEKEIDSTNGLP